MEEWSDLHQDLLRQIFNCLALRDIQRFGAVCHSWRVIRKECVAELPVLFIRDIENYVGMAQRRRSKFELSDSSIEYLSVAEKRIYRMELPDKFIIHSQPSWCQGWILLHSTKTHPTGDVFFSPFGHKYIPIPRKFSCLPTLCSDWVFYSTPASNGVLFINGFLNTFLVCDIRKWGRHPKIYRHYSNENLSSNVVFCEGRLFALTGGRSILIANAYNLQAMTFQKIEMEEVVPSLDVQGQSGLLDTTVLVESCGKILMVALVGSEQESLSCRVFQADLIEKVWVEVRNLGDKMLFMNENSSISVSAGVTGGGRANRIFYAPDAFGLYIEIELGTHENKIYYHRAKFVHRTHWFSWLGKGIL